MKRWQRQSGIEKTKSNMVVGGKTESTDTGIKWLAIISKKTMLWIHGFIEVSWFFPSYICRIYVLTSLIISPTYFLQNLKQNYCKIRISMPKAYRMPMQEGKVRECICILCYFRCSTFSVNSSEYIDNLSW